MINEKLINDIKANLIELETSIKKESQAGVKHSINKLIFQLSLLECSMKITAPIITVCKNLENMFWFMQSKHLDNEFVYYNSKQIQALYLWLRDLDALVDDKQVKHYINQLKTEKFIIIDEHGDFVEPAKIKNDDSQERMISLLDILSKITKDISLFQGTMKCTKETVLSEKLIDKSLISDDMRFVEQLTDENINLCISKFKSNDKTIAHTKKEQTSEEKEDDVISLSDVDEDEMSDSNKSDDENEPDNDTSDEEATKKIEKEVIQPLASTSNPKISLEFTYAPKIEEQSNEVKNIEKNGMLSSHSNSIFKNKSQDSSKTTTDENPSKMSALKSIFENRKS